MDYSGNFQWFKIKLFKVICKNKIKNLENQKINRLFITHPYPLHWRGLEEFIF